MITAIQVFHSQLLELEKVCLNFINYKCLSVKVLSLKNKFTS